MVLTSHWSDISQKTSPPENLPPFVRLPYVHCSVVTDRETLVQNRYHRSLISQVRTIRNAGKWPTDTVHALRSLTERAIGQHPVLEYGTHALKLSNLGL